MTGTAQSGRNPRRRRRVGDVVRVPLGDGTFGFGQVLREPLVAFFALRSGGEVRIDDVVSAEVLFSIWVMNSAVRKDWDVIGHCEVSPAIEQHPTFFKKDPFNGRYSLTLGGGTEVPAQLGDVQGLERAAVWSSNHVESRLLDHFEGRPNRWVEALGP